MGTFSGAVKVEDARIKKRLMMWKITRFYPLPPSRCGKFHIFFSFFFLNTSLTEAVSKHVGEGSVAGDAGDVNHAALGGGEVRDAGSGEDEG